MPVVQAAFAFEQPTHRIMAERAAFASVLATQSMTLSNLGLGNMTVQSLDGKTIYQSIRDGAEFEDNLEIPLFRPKNHFYNPLTGQGLNTTLGGFSIVGNPSPTWGLENQGDIPDQIFSFNDARNYFYTGLTDPDKATREKKLALMFRSLGQVIHLVQDAAQPQHTRNDAHILGFNTSLYETITNTERVTLPYGGYPPVILNSAKAYWHTQNPGADILQGKGMAEYSNRNFVSAGTNFRFYAPFINLIIPDPNFNLPLIDTDASGNEIFEIRDITELDSGTSLQGSLYFYQTTVTDSYAAAMGCPPDVQSSGFACLNKRATTLSIFDDELKNYIAPQGTRGLFSLNRLNFEEANKFLIPRAVGYSAGLIDYFFRGKIDLVVDPNDAARFVIDNLGTDGMNGTFTLYYDGTDGLRHPVPGAQWMTAAYAVGGVLAAGGNMSVPGFLPPTTPAPKTSGEYMLVFTGSMGTESPSANFMGAVAGKLVRLTSSPNVLLASAWDANGGCEFYRSADQGQTWSLVSIIADSSCYPNSMVYVGNRTVLFLVEDYLTGDRFMYRSSDAGDTWSRVTQDPFTFNSQPYSNGWVYLGNNRIFTSDVGPGSFVGNFARISDDQGATWTRLGEIHPGHKFWMSHAFLGNDTVLAAPKIEFGLNLSRSLDGGQTWSFIQTFPNASMPWALDRISDLVYLGNNRVLLGGNNTFNAPLGSFFYRSDDGGLSWYKLATSVVPLSLVIDLVYMGNDTVLLYQDGDVTAFRSTDAGANWVAFSNPLPKPFLNVIYLGDNGAVPGLY